VVVKPGFFSRLLNEPYEGLWKGLHASASYLAFARQFCGIAPPVHEAPPVPRLELAQAPHRNGRIAIHVGGGRKAKRVAPQSWLEVARGLRARTGKEIAFISGPEEPELAHELSRSMEGALPLANLSIEALAREVAQSGFFVGTDSGPGHMAAALQTPSLTLIERHVAPRYSTLGAHARQLAHAGIKTVGATDIVEAALAHPAFPHAGGAARERARPRRAGMVFAPGVCHAGLARGGAHAQRGFDVPAPARGHFKVCRESQSAAAHTRSAL
jgi:ADP-heptose:LPS heptosyltransferase